MKVKCEIILLDVSVQHDDRIDSVPILTVSSQPYRTVDSQRAKLSNNLGNNTDAILSAVHFHLLEKWHSDHV